MSCEDERIRAISSSARPRLILDLSTFNSGSLGFPRGREAEESKEEKYPLSSIAAILRFLDLKLLEGSLKSSAGDGVSSRNEVQRLIGGDE